MWIVHGHWMWKDIIFLFSWLAGNSVIDTFHSCCTLNCTWYSHHMYIGDSVIDVPVASHIVELPSDIGNTRLIILRQYGTYWCNIQWQCMLTCGQITMVISFTKGCRMDSGMSPIATLQCHNDSQPLKSYDILPISIDTMYLSNTSLTYFVYQVVSLWFKRCLIKHFSVCWIHNSHLHVAAIAHL